MHYIIYSDGAARGNPGPAGAGAVVMESNGRVLGEVSEYLGETTNNQAEYQALLLAVEKAVSLGAKALTIYVDSELIARQLTGAYRVKHPGLKPLFQAVNRRLHALENYTIEHLPRDQNKRADELANQAIDRAL